MSAIPPSATAIPKAPLPAPVPMTVRRFRQPKKNIPQTKPERDRVLGLVRDYLERHEPVPPLPQEELRVHAERLVAEAGLNPAYTDYTGVLLNNEMWRESLATIPYEKRLLLMPKCLRVESKCPAPFDEFGLLCKQCGLCTIQDFQNEAERLGYAVLVAEGSAIVMSLIQTGKIYQFPVILFGRHYWAGLIRWITSRVAAEGKISPGDLDLLLLTDDPAEAAQAVIDAHAAQTRSGSA